MTPSLTNKRILVTGGTGFLGSHVMDALEQQGCTKGFIYAGLKPRTNYARLEPAAYTCRSKEKDLTDQSVCREVMEALSPQIVIHLAALTGGIGANQVAPADFFYQNAMMGINLLHEAYRCGTDKFVSLGSVCAYPKHAPIPFQEKDLWNGYPEETNAPYGLAKRMLLVQSQAYRQQYGFNAIHLLPVNLYGPRDHFDLNKSHVIPALIKKFITAMEDGQSKVTIWGTGKATREFLYVEDAAEAIIKATTHYDSGEPINIGTGREISIYDLAYIIRDLVGHTGDVVWDHTKPDGQPRRCLDVTKAATLFNFKAKTDLTTGLERTIEWYVKQTLDDH